MGIKVDWINKIIGEISTKRYHYIMVHVAQSLRNGIEVMQKKIEDIEHLLRELETEMVYRNLTTRL